MKAGRQTWRTMTWRGFRYVKLRVRECPQALRLHAVRAIETTYPFEERGSFKSSDSRLNAVFEMCRNTLRLCSHEFIMDTPWREQAQWLGDISLVTSGGIRACFGDTVLVDKFMRQSAMARRPEGLIQNVTNREEAPGARNIPDYSFWWVMGVWNHYLYTGEERLIAQSFPTAMSIVDAVRPYINAHGLLCDIPLWVFIDWANADRRGESTALNAIFFGALHAAARMAEVMGRGAKAAELRRLAEGVRANFVSRFFDPHRGVFADANVGGQLSDMVSEHANVAAIHMGLCDGGFAAGIIRRIYEERSVTVTECTPFFSAVALRALDGVGRLDLALRVLLDRWGRRMVDRGFTSTTEEWGENGSWRDGPFKGFMRSHSHAWSAAPAEFLIANLAGIRILEPGCRRVEVDPRPVDFDYDLTYPTPLGGIRVSRQQGKTTVCGDKRIEIVAGGR
jgi:hypothetical protein